MNPLTAFFWLVEHWWIFAIIAALALGVLLWTGVVQLAAVVVALAKIAAAIAKFFTEPADQIAAKILYGFIVFVVAGSVFYQLGKSDERAVWKKAELAHAAAMAKLSSDAAAEADEKVRAATEAEHANTLSAEQRIKEYEQKLATAPVDDCRINDDDLRAAGVQPQSNGADKRRNPIKLQRPPAGSRAR